MELLSGLGIGRVKNNQKAAIKRFRVHVDCSLVFCASTGTPELTKLSHTKITTMDIARQLHIYFPEVTLGDHVLARLSESYAGAEAEAEAEAEATEAVDEESPQETPELPTGDYSATCSVM